MTAILIVYPWPERPYDHSGLGPLCTQNLDDVIGVMNRFSIPIEDPSIPCRRRRVIRRTSGGIPCIIITAHDVSIDV
jgi:hypothetical protein